jgi:hydroxyacylglutathione hydrolase
MTLRHAIVPVTAFQQNSTIIWEEETRRGLIVDPGGEAPRLQATAGRLGLTIERILLTHGHIDHAGGATELAELLSVPIEGPEEQDNFLLESLSDQGYAFGYGDIRNVSPSRWLREGDYVILGAHRFDVLHCPGHTPGHIVFVDHTARLAIVGDVLFQGSIGRTDFPYGNYNQLIRAIFDKLLPLGDDMRFLCGHGPGSIIGVERDSNPFLRFGRP